eukprot:6800278-Pyramimonas_sp.AAC.1
MGGGEGRGGESAVRCRRDLDHTDGNDQITWTRASFTTSSSYSILSPALLPHNPCSLHPPKSSSHLLTCSPPS